jgi:hypothetical protein
MKNWKTPEADTGQRPVFFGFQRRRENNEKNLTLPLEEIRNPMLKLLV